MQVCRSETFLWGLQRDFIVRAMPITFCGKSHSLDLQQYAHGPELFTKAARLTNRDKIPSERGRTGLQKKTSREWVAPSI